jgi:hypothetical protein
MVLCWKQKRLGCAFYDETIGRLYVMEDASEEEDLSLARLSNMDEWK